MKTSRYPNEYFNICGGLISLHNQIMMRNKKNFQFTATGLEPTTT